MSQKTKNEVMERLRRNYAKAGPEYKSQLIDQAIDLLGYHRKAAIRALNWKQAPVRTPALIVGRPREYEPEKLLKVLKPIWFAAFQPCGSRLHALLPEWLPAYEMDHRQLDGDLRKSLLSVSARTLDRIMSPLRIGLRRRGGTLANQPLAGWRLEPLDEQTCARPLARRRSQNHRPSASREWTGPIHSPGDG